jgi:hypothetical protein
MSQMRRFTAKTNIFTISFSGIEDVVGGNLEAILEHIADPFSISINDALGPFYARQ